MRTLEGLLPIEESQSPVAGEEQAGRVLLAEGSAAHRPPGIGGQLAQPLSVKEDLGSRSAV